MKAAITKKLKRKGKRREKMKNDWGRLFNKNEMRTNDGESQGIMDEIDEKDVAEGSARDID